MISQANRFRINDGLMLGPLKRWAKWSMGAYVMSLLAVSVIFAQNMMAWQWYVFGVVETFIFFIFSWICFRDWSWNHMNFEKKLFWTSLIVRLIYVIFSYWFYYSMTDTYFEFHAADSLFYEDGGKLGADVLRSNFEAFFKNYYNYLGADISDMGYPFFLSLVYWVTDDSIFVARVMNALFSSLTVLLMYRYAVRLFGEPVGRLTGVMMMLMPSFILFCGLHLKESLMTFLVVLFMERADYLLSKSKMLIGPTLLVVTIGVSLFFFRTILGAVAFLALMTTVVLSNSKIMGWGRRILIGGLALIFVSLMIGTRMQDELDDILNTDIRAQQQVNLQWRSERNDENGTANHFAKYAGAAVFAPLIFTIPFPTMTDVPLNEQQLMSHGGYFVKNVLSFFVILCLFFLLFSGKWRNYVMPLSFTIGYLIILVFSSFAQAGRFHIPVLPFELMFAAYGLSLLNSNKKYKRWFVYWLIGLVVVIVAWNWFKLAGRGMA